MGSVDADEVLQHGEMLHSARSTEDSFRSARSTEDSFRVDFSHAEFAYKEAMFRGVGFRVIVGELLRFAVEDGNLKLVTQILASYKASDLLNLVIGHARGGRVSSPVFVAVQAGHLEVVQLLIKYLKAKGQFAYHLNSFSEHKNWLEELVQWAVRWNHVSIVKYLVREYKRLFHDLSNVEYIMGLGLGFAAFQSNLDVLKMFLEWTEEQLPEADLPACFQCLLPCCRFQPSRRVLKDSHSYSPKRVASSLLNDGLTALHLAAQSGFLEAVKLLVNLEDNLVNEEDNLVNEPSIPELFTPLHLAANFGHAEVVDFLMKSDATTMARLDRLGRTPLHYAAREGHVHVVQKLVNAHEDIALVPDYDGLLALHMAARAGHVEVIKALNPFGGIMCQARHSLAVKTWVECVYTGELVVRSRSLRGKCSLIFNPGKKWNFPRVKLFDSLFWRTKGFTPLHFAARYGHGAAAVEELLKNRDAEPGSSCALLMDGSGALSLQDSAGFLAYDWMKVHGQGNTFVASCVAGEKSSSIASCTSSSHESEMLRGVEVMKLELEKRGSSSKITGEMSDSIASHIREEKQAMEELQRAWKSGDGIEDAVNREPVFQWLLEDDLLDGSSIGKPFRFGELEQALQKSNFTAAKHILLNYPSPQLSLDAARVRSRVQETLERVSNDSPYRSLGDFLTAFLTREELASGVDALRWLAAWAKKNEFKSLLGMIIDRSEVKRGLYEDRQLYVDCANAMLVGATLIAGVAFQGWLQPPLGYSYEYQGSEYADVHESAVRAFWWFNNGAFFFSVASLIAGAKGAVPVGQVASDIVRSLEKAQRAVGVASWFLGMALICVVGAFSAAGFAVVPPLHSDLQIMRTCVLSGASLCAVVLFWFALGVLPLVIGTVRDMAAVLIDVLLVCTLFIPVILIFVLSFACLFVIVGCSICCPPLEEFVKTQLERLGDTRILDWVYTSFEAATKRLMTLGYRDLDGHIVSRFGR